jgi:AbiU2
MNVQIDAVTKAKAAADALINIAISALYQEAELRLLATSADLVNRVNEQGISNGLRQLRSTYLRSLVLTCTTALTDDGKKVASVRNVCRLLTDSKVKNSFRENCGNTLFPPLNHNQTDLAAESDFLNRLRYEKGQAKFDQKLDALITLNDAFNKTDLRTRLKNLRDKTIAHQELIPDTSGNLQLLTDEEISLTYGEVWAVVSNLEKAASLSHWICNGTDFDFQSSRNDANRKATDFWSKLIEIKLSAR